MRSVPETAQLIPEAESEIGGIDLDNGPLVAVVLAADSDMVVMREAIAELTQNGIGNETAIVSAHQEQERVHEFAQGARRRGIKLIIVAAGAAVELPGAIAAQTDLPVIAVPIVASNAREDALAALHAAAQTPAGVPLACVAPNAARNAAILAARILFA